MISLQTVSNSLGRFFGVETTTPPSLNLTQLWCPTSDVWTAHDSLLTVDGSEIRHSPSEVGSLPQYLQGFVHLRWLFEISEPSTVLLRLYPLMLLYMLLASLTVMNMSPAWSKRLVSCWDAWTEPSKFTSRFSNDSMNVVKMENSLRFE